MANTAQLYNVSQGGRHSFCYVAYGDTDLANELMLDVSGLSPAPTKLAVERIRLTAMAETGGMYVLATFNDATETSVGAAKSFELISEADGDIDINITESGAATWYLAVVLPNGSLNVSDAITFA